jgi:hypothetical protein
VSLHVPSDSSPGRRVEPKYVDQVLRCFEDMTSFTATAMSPVVANLVVLCFLICLAFSLHSYVKRRGSGFQVARVLHRTNNRIYALFSSALAISLMLFPSQSGRLGKIYHLSKFYEAIDIYLFLLSGYIPNLHFAVHHATTPIITLFSVLERPRKWWIWPTIANLIHHTVMYTAFGGCKSFQRYLVYTGSVQLAIGLISSILYVYKTGVLTGVIPICGYCVYAALYAMEVASTQTESR